MTSAETGETPRPAKQETRGWDCHVHVFGPQQRFPFMPNRRYTPEDATLDQYQAATEQLGVDRAVLTAPSVYGIDNLALLEALTSGGPAVRGVVMVDRPPDRPTLRRWHAAGVRAVRTQIKADGASPLRLDDLQAVAERIAPLHWHVEIHVDVAVVTNVDTLFAKLPVPVVIEHMGHMSTTHSLDNAGFGALLRFLQNGGWVKLSGPYINSAAGAPYEDVAPYVAALLEAAPDRAVWGSNWPHPHQHPEPDNGLLGRLRDRWLPTAALRRQVLDTNPARLYDF